MKAIKASVTTLNLEFLMADILKEQRNPTSTTSKRTFVHRANRPSKNPTRQNKGPKRTKSSRPPNRRRRPNRGSNHNTHPEDDEEASKDAETEPESDPEPKLESFTCVIRNFDLDDSKSSCSIGSTSSKDSAEDSETEGGYLAAFIKSKRPLKQSPNRPDLLLYDTGTTDHIVNNKKWFKDDYTPNRGQLKTLKTGGGPVIPKGNSTAVFTVLSQINPLKYHKVIFKDALYFLDIDVNLFSGLKHYKSGGYLEKNRLCTFQGGIIARLNIVKTGFFISLKGYKSRSTFANFCFSSHRDDVYIPVSAKPLKAEFTRLNASKGGTPKPSLHRPKDRQRSEVSERVNIGDNGFKDLSFWESIEKGPRIHEDRPYELV